jgi:DNA-directed RNA polymerase specialized sigma subunit
VQALRSQVRRGDVDVGDAHRAPEIAELVQTVEQAEHTDRDAVEAAASVRKEAAQTLLHQGYPMRDIGRLIGISHQRVSQILNEAS